MSNEELIKLLDEIGRARNSAIQSTGDPELASAYRDTLVMNYPTLSAELRKRLASDPPPNRDRAIALLRQFRETSDPAEIEQQKATWAELEKALRGDSDTSDSFFEARIRNQAENLVDNIFFPLDNELLGDKLGRLKTAITTALLTAHNAVASDTSQWNRAIGAAAEIVEERSEEYRQQGERWQLKVMAGTSSEDNTELSHALRLQYISDRDQCLAKHSACVVAASAIRALASTPESNGRCLAVRGQTRCNREIEHHGVHSYEYTAHGL